ncbi:hypothetical protein [Sphingomonas sp.]|jgi:hypothetical protein|uniref:hypothetical protein n=1 Tax=Sphingomonas sp. TaxID=28214 RepID=UPI002E334108|nr:hypothetical protein [Sphingomonas sp.]HEX4692989.1 hypothetical protein [Sphingomonas sp.]
MIKAIHAGLALMAASCLLCPGLASARQGQPRSVAAARIGLITSRSPRMEPQLVRRGGYTAIAAMVRPRFVPGMLDIYPSATSGFRLSIGNRYFNKVNYTAAAEQASHGLLYDPHMVRGGIGLMRAFRRYTPALTIGYDVAMAPRLVVGLEGGALSGRAINQGPRGRAFRNDDRLASHAGLNPIATFAIRYAF